MGEFRIRATAQRLSTDWNNYLIKGVDTIEEAASRLAALQKEAHESEVGFITTDGDVVRLGYGRMDDLEETPPDSEKPRIDKFILKEDELPEVVFTQIDENGNIVRHLTPGMPYRDVVVERSRIGEPLDMDWPDYDWSGSNRS